MATYYVDPVNGLDANAGDSFDSGHPWKTLKHAFAAGDNILVAKSPETAAAGTVSATQGSVTVATTNDLTGVIAQYTIIRIGGDNTLYMVRAITTTTITLYRPYRGTTGSGKGLTYFTGLPTSASQDWYPTAMTGTKTSPITVQGGINTSTLDQDGFTILYGNSATYCLYGAWTFINLSNIATLYFEYPWSVDFNSCNLTRIFSFRSTRFGLGQVWSKVVADSIVSELGRWHCNIQLIGCTINQIETAEMDNAGWDNSGITAYDSVVVGHRNAGYSGQPGLRIYGGFYKGIRFVDSILDELNSGCPGINIYYGTATLENVVLQNPSFGLGTLFTLNGTFYGALQLSNVNGSATDHRTYFGAWDSSKYSLLSYDSVVFNPAAPAAKISLFQSIYPTKITHYIPCDPGVTKTISVYLRKNSSYGSAMLPFMRLRWLTGTPPNLVSNVHDVAMTDTNDTFVQVSYAVTPSVQGAVIVELFFQSANSGAIAWYDDIEVT